MSMRSRIGNFGVCVALAALLAGCAGAPGYPALPAGDVIGQKTLTPKEQEAEIKSLNDAQVQNTSAAGAQAKPQYIPAAQTTP